jgi:DNA-binding CsgD family transcriptional regulator
VLRLLLSGLSEKQIAARLDLSRHTVHNHVKEIYRVVGVQSRAELMAILLSP